MKKAELFTKLGIITTIVFFLSMISSAGLFAQDTEAEKKQKVIKVKVNTDGDGESITIDTSFVIDGDFDEEAFEAYMSEFDDQMKEMDIHLEGLKFEEEELEKMEEHLKGMNVYLHDFEKGCDDYRKMRNVYRNYRTPRHLEFYSGHPGSHFNWVEDCHHDAVKQYSHQKGESLSDVLGDIPMSAVKSYKIRETKYGKKIVIEVNDDYPEHLTEEIIVIRAPEAHVKKPKIRREIIIETEDDEEVDDE